MGSGRSKAWLARAGSQFARTVYTELRRAGHDNNGVIRFINELMDLLHQDAGQGEQSMVVPPALLDPEQGLPDQESAFEILDFELRRWQGDRRRDMLVVAVIDVVIPQFRSGTDREQIHETFAESMVDGMRSTDCFAHLGSDRYLLILPQSKKGVREAVLRRMTSALEAHLMGVDLRVRWSFADSTMAEARSLFETALLDEAQTVRAKGAPSSTPVPASLTGDGPQRLLLALGGGAARAVSHAGVIDALRSAGFETAGIAGCSAGALVGAMVTRGMKTEQVVARFAEFASTPIYRSMRRAYAEFLREDRAMRKRGRTRYFGASAQAFYSETALASVSNELLMDFVGHFVGKDCDMAQLDHPFSVVATDLAEGRPVVLSHGSLHAALAASCAVPGLFAPQRLGDRVFVDGSVVTEVPVWAAQLLGVDLPVLAVHMGRPHHRVRDYATSAEVTVRCHALVHAELVREQLRQTRYLISVPVHDVGWLDFRRAKRTAELGREAALGLLAELDGEL